MEVWLDHRAVEGFADVVGAATPKYKTKHTPTHIASSRDGIPHSSPVPLSHYPVFGPVVYSGIHRAVAFLWVPLKVW